MLELQDPSHSYVTFVLHYELDHFHSFINKSIDSHSQWSENFNAHVIFFLVWTSAIFLSYSLVWCCGACWTLLHVSTGTMCHVLCFDYLVFRSLSCFQVLYHVFRFLGFLSCFFPCHLASLKSPVFCFTAAPRHQSPPTVYSFQVSISHCEFFTLPFMPRFVCFVRSGFAS